MTTDTITANDETVDTSKPVSVFDLLDPIQLQNFLTSSDLASTVEDISVEDALAIGTNPFSFEEEEDRFDDRLFVKMARLADDDPIVSTIQSVRKRKPDTFKASDQFCPAPTAVDDGCVFSIIVATDQDFENIIGFTTWRLGYNRANPRELVRSPTGTRLNFDFSFNAIFVMPDFRKNRQSFIVFGASNFWLFENIIVPHLCSAHFDAEDNGISSIIVSVYGEIYNARAMWLSEAFDAWKSEFYHFHDMNVDPSVPALPISTYFDVEY